MTTTPRTEYIPITDRDPDGRLERFRVTIDGAFAGIYDAKTLEFTKARNSVQGHNVEKTIRSSISRLDGLEIADKIKFRPS